jgi:glycosyltransferase involved in cell wall biosynthesis
MNVAIVTPFGAEKRLDAFAEFLIAQHLIKDGQDARLFTYNLENNPEYADKRLIYKTVPTMRCRQRYGFSPRLIIEILKFRPQLVMLCHIRSWLNLSGYVAARLVGAKIVFKVIGFLHDPCIVSDRDNPLETVHPKITLLTSVSRLVKSYFETPPTGCGRWENFVTHYPMARADRLITITEFEREWVKRVMGLDSKLVPWGVKLEADQASESEPQLPEGCPRENFLFFIGQVKRRKGWDTIIEALALLKEQGVRKDLVFVTSSSPDEYKEAHDLVERLGVKDRVHFLYRVSNEEKAWLYRRATGLLAPSRYEGFGLTPFEAFDFGVPVFGTDIPVYSDFLKDGYNSLISKKGDPVTLAENVKRLDQPGMRDVLIRGGKETVAKYTDKQIYEAYQKAVEGLI